MNAEKKQVLSQFKKKLRQYKKDIGKQKGGSYTFNDFATEMGVSQRYLENILCSLLPSRAFLKKLYEFSGKDAHYWLTDEEFTFIYKLDQRTSELGNCIQRLNTVGKKRIALYIDANLDQLNEGV